MSQASSRPASLSVVLPAFNEEANLDRTLTDLFAFLPTVVESFEVIVVNDGSRDGTQSVIDAWTGKDKRVIGVRHTVNRGYGAALCTGFRAAKLEHVFFMDSDGQFDIKDLPRLFTALPAAEFVTGYRESRQDGLLRRLNALAYNRTVVRGLFGTRVRDVNCAFKIFPRRLVDLAEPILSTGALINCEMFYKARVHGMRLAEVPVKHLPRVSGTQTGAHPLVILRMFREAFKLWLRLNWTPGSAWQVGTQALLLTTLLTAMTMWGVVKAGAPLPVNPTTVTAGNNVPLSGVPAFDYMRHLDANWYLDIATHGYRMNEGQANVVFFPLLPILTRGIHELTGLSLPMAGQLVVWLFTLVAGVLMALFARDILRGLAPASSEGMLWKSLGNALPLLATATLLLHPIGVVLHSVYPESLFISLSLALILAWRRQNTAWMVACTFLLALTRPQGLFVPMAFWIYDGYRTLQARRLVVGRVTVGASLAALAAILLFAWHLDLVTGAPWSFWQKRSAWDSNSSWTHIPRLLAPIITKQFFLAKMAIYATLAGAYLLWRQGDKLPAILAALFVVLPLHKGDLGDMTRYSLLATFAWVPLLAVAARIPALLIGGFGISAYLYGLFLSRWLHRLWVG